ncbi:hypothetical protein D5F53_22175 [Paenibacillus lautus]|uniref:Uncharacterized protein n=1 Tax=Paenibacillus lautus TaxID=1401 RepID=A0A385TPW2_PAELA|nr:hypothetical protein D5F53_22175 [Paenibacillus lautus]
METLKRDVPMRRSAYVSFLRSLLFPNFMNENSNVDIRQQLILPMRVFLRKTFSRPLRFSGIDSSVPLVRPMASFFIVGVGGERVELSFIDQKPG